MGALTIRTASPAEVGTMVDWAAAEGWNPGLDDATAFRRCDPEGFLVGIEGGAPAACISVVGYGEDFGFLGFYICRPDRRGRGYGRAMWDAGMARLAGRTVGLDGVVAQQANYARSGFVLAHRNIRYGGTVADAGDADPRLALVETRDRALLAAVAAYDRSHFPAGRPAFLEGWIAAPHHRTLAWVEDGAVRGYGTVRACREGRKIGPLFADRPAIAGSLFAALAAAAGGGPVFLDLPEPNRAAVALAERHGLAPAFETARMYRGAAPDLPLARIYGITSFELG